MKRISKDNLYQTCDKPEKHSLPPYPLCEINLLNIAHNAEAFKNILKPNSEIMAIVKADAYGHGAVKVARQLEKNGIRFFGVATVQEGIELRHNGISGTILILVPLLFSEFEAAVKYNLTVSLSSLEEAIYLNNISFQTDLKSKAHILVDTGLSRGGFFPGELKKALPELRMLKAIEIDGIWTHFATLHSLKNARKIVESFRQLVSYAKRFLYLPYTHMANSLASCVLPESHFDLVRPGLGLYGYLPDGDKDLPLKPAMHLTAPIVSIKRYKAKTSVSYEGTYVLEKDSTLATIRFGYADGYNFNLGNKSTVVVGDHICPVVGRIMMDQMLVNLGDEKAKIGDRAILVGTPGPSPCDLATCAKMTPHTILASVGNKRAKRIYIDSETKNNYTHMNAKLPV